MRGLLDPAAEAGTSPFDHTVYVIASDGDLQEGVTSEASSLAGHQELGNLVVIYDDNKISIENDTDIAFTEDVLGRYESYGWHTQRVDWTATGEYVEDMAALDAAIRAAKAETSRPSIISLRTIIGWPSPTKQNTGGIHGSKLGAEEVAGLKKVLGFDPEKNFQIEDDVLAHAREVATRGAQLHASWNETFNAWKSANPEEAALLERLQAGELPEGWTEKLPTFEPGSTMATRAASGKVINAIADELPELWAAPPTWPVRTTPPSRPRSPSLPSAAPPIPGRPARTAVCCTSASASTPPRRSSTASCSPARPARSPAPS